jgi:hypothetical protein
MNIKGYYHVLWTWVAMLGDPTQRLLTRFRIPVPMADEPKKIWYQCAWSGKVYDSEEKALAGCEGPIQAFIKKYDRYPKKGFFGTVTWRKGD